MKWLVVLRFLLAGVCALDVALAEHREAAPQPALVLLAAVLALDLAYLLPLRAAWVRDLRRYAAFQVAADVFLVSALVYLSGGVRSNFLPLYFASVLSATILVSPRAGVLLASLSTTLLALVTIAYSLAAARYDPGLPLVAPELVAQVPQEIDRALAFLVAYGVSLHLVAGVAGALVARSARVRILTEEILAHIGEGLLVVDARGAAVHMNERARALLGLPPGQPGEGRSLADVLGTDGGEGVHEVELPLPGGGRRPLEVRVSRIPDPAGRARGRIAILADLTDRRRVEATDRALARLEAIRELASGIAHEIRNPLASIRGCAQELARSSRATETDRRLAGILCRESDRLDRIVEEFLRFSRLRPLRPRAADLSRLAADVALLLRNRDDARGVEVVLEAPAEAACTCDPEQLTQVLLNLGVNGLQAMGGQGRLTLRVGEAARGEGPEPEGWAIRVLDQGPGVPPGERERIFAPFYTTRAEGTGLGLSFVSRIVDAHGGRVEVVEAPGGGADFGVWLPRRGVVPEATGAAHG